MTDTLLDTPTGMIVYDGPPVTPEWFAARRNGITGTDLPKILGISKYGNALSVWLDKRGELLKEDQDEASEAAYWGTVFEEPVARRWADLHRTMVNPIGVLAHHAMPWMRASLDRTVEVCPDGDGRSVCGLEIKTRSAYKAHEYALGYPDDVLAQVAWSRAVSGFDHMHLAVLLGGQRLRWFRYDRDDELEGYLLAQAQPVWDAVVDGPPPTVAPNDALLDLLNAMYSVREGDRVLPPEAHAYMGTYTEAHLAEQKAKARKREATAALVQMLDDGDRALLPEDEGVAFTYRRPAPTLKAPVEGLRRLKEDQPKMFDYLVKHKVVVEHHDGPRFYPAFLRRQGDE